MSRSSIVGTKALDRPKGYPGRGLVVVLRNLENALETGSLRQSDSPPTHPESLGWLGSFWLFGRPLCPCVSSLPGRSQAPVPTVDPKSVVRAWPAVCHVASGQGLPASAMVQRLQYCPECPGCLPFLQRIRLKFRFLFFFFSFVTRCKSHPKPA